MLKVFFDTDNIGMITDMLDAEEPSHYPIQRFLSIREKEKRLEKRDFSDFEQSKTCCGRGGKILSQF